MMFGRFLNKSILVLSGIYLLFQLGSVSHHDASGSCHASLGKLTKTYADAEKILAVHGFRDLVSCSSPVFVTTVQLVTVSPLVATYVAPLRSRAPPV